jgi:hypothetical protein
MRKGPGSVYDNWFPQVKNSRYKPNLSYSLNRIGGVMVNVLANSAIDNGFGPRMGEIKDNKI